MTDYVGIGYEYAAKHSFDLAEKFDLPVDYFCDENFADLGELYILGLLSEIQDVDIKYEKENKKMKKPDFIL